VLGLALWWLDLLLYVSLAADGGAVAWAGWAIIFYMGIIWLHTLSYAWTLMVCRDDLRLLPLLRNGLLLTLRYPGHTIANSVVGGVFLLVAMYAPPLLGLILPALVALLGLHSLYMLAPELVPDDADMLRVVG
ncbi:MAG TPA: hypothetical protein VFR15_15165, partial [Chloroflexia bacterium]|nr:hypothetical protein [Chloroflexia bacterium]